jgi:hypothetical protein
VEEPEVLTLLMMIAQVVAERADINMMQLTQLLAIVMA